MSYTPDVCPMGTGIGRYDNSADSSTHAIYCIHCDTECALPSVRCPACLLWHGLNKPVLKRALDYYPIDIKSDTRSFLIFSRLTEQLRYLIWKEALPGPRIVHLRRRLLKLPDGKTSFGYESPSITNVIFINRSHPVTIYNDLEIIDLQNFATSLSIYESPYDPVAERTLQRRQESFRNRYRSHNVKLGPSLANIRTLDIIRQQEAASHGGVAPYEMPIIECKTMTTMAMEKKLDDPEANYQLKKIDYEKRQRKKKEMLNGTFLLLKLEI